MKNKIGIVNLIIAVLCFGFIFIALFGEIACFQNYINSLPEKNFEGLGAIGILLLGIIMGFALAVCGTLVLISAIGCLKAAKEKTVKAQIILGFVGKILTAICFIVYFIVMLDAYPQGIFLKVLYAIVAVAATVASVFDCIALQNK